MKKLITTYTFIPAAKTVQLTGLDSVDIKGLLLVTNVTDNIILYNFADPLKGGTAAGNTITLTYDTAAMDAGDDLQIFYDDADYTQTATGPLTNTELRAAEVVTADGNFEILLRQILGAVNASVWYTPATNVLNVAGAVTVSSGTVTAVTTVAGLTNIGSDSAAPVVAAISAESWAVCVRNLLT